MALGHPLRGALGADTIEGAVEALKARAASLGLTVAATVEERVDLGLAIEALPRRDRTPPGERWDVIEVVGPAVYNSSGTYKRAKSLVHASRATGFRAPHIVAAAQEALARVNAGEISLTGGYEAYRAAERQPPPPEGLGADGLPLVPPPTPNARTPKARQLRILWIKAMAAKGTTSEQIAERLGISPEGLRKIARDISLIIPADVVLGRYQRKGYNPAKAAQSAVDDLDAIIWSLDRIEPGDLDPVRAREWADQLQEHARAIFKTARRLKEN